MNKTIQTKRKKPSGSNYRVLYAKTGRKRKIHAATATMDPGVELDTDVPNIGIGRALLVILVLHIFAIAAIYIHSTFFGNEGGTTADKGQQQPAKTPAAAVAPAAKEVSSPTRPSPAVAAADAQDLNSKRYIVVTGDSYGRIAQVRNVDEQALRALNGNRPLRAGVVLDLPAELSSRPVAVRQTPPARVRPAEAPSLAVIDGDRREIKASKPSTRAVERHDDYNVAGAPKAVVVKPTIPAPAAAARGVRDSGQRYTIRSGDTLWRISNKFKVSRAALLKINGIKDPNKLYAGRTIKIPAK